MRGSMLQKIEDRADTAGGGSIGFACDGGADRFGRDAILKGDGDTDGSIARYGGEL